MHSSVLIAHALTLTDPPRGEEYWTAASDDFQHATDLVRFVRAKYGDTFAIGVAGASRYESLAKFRALIPRSSGLGYPEGHADSPDKQADIDFLFEKQEAGADFVITQLFYDVDVFLQWYKRCRERGVSVRLPPTCWRR